MARVSTTPRRSAIVSADEQDCNSSFNSDERWMAAVHEAGHAVIARLVGYSVVEVGIESDRFKCKARTDPIEYDEANDAIYTLAGEKAENAILGSEGETLLSDIDRDHFRSLGPGDSASEERRAWREVLEHRAEEHVENERNAIEAVAEQLMRPLYRLTGNEIRTIVKALAPPVGIRS